MWGHASVLLYSFGDDQHIILCQALACQGQDQIPFPANMPSQTFKKTSQRISGDIALLDSCPPRANTLQEIGDFVNGHFKLLMVGLDLVQHEHDPFRAGMPDTQLREEALSQIRVIEREIVSQDGRGTQADQARRFGQAVRNGFNEIADPALRFQGFVQPRKLIRILPRLGTSLF